jgi:hypothetical protein
MVILQYPIRLYTIMKRISLKLTGMCAIHEHNHIYLFCR